MAQRLHRRKLRSIWTPIRSYRSKRIDQCNTQTRDVQRRRRRHRSCRHLLLDWCLGLWPSLSCSTAMVFTGDSRLGTCWQEQTSLIPRLMRTHELSG